MESCNPDAQNAEEEFGKLINENSVQAVSQFAYVEFEPNQVVSNLPKIQLFRYSNFS